MKADTRLAARAYALIFIGAALYALAMRTLAYDGVPLWYDESWTALASSSPTFPIWLRTVWVDSNAPLYYGLMALWPFESDWGLRATSLIFLIATAVLATTWRIPGLSRLEALCWASLILLWRPGESMMFDARYYSLLMLISTAQSIALIRFFDRPNPGNALIWSSLAALAALTHYFTLLPSGVVAGFIVVRERRVLLRYWASTIPMLPVAGWIAFHLPRLLVYAKPDVSWYKPIDGSNFLNFIEWPISNDWVVVTLILVIAILFRRKAPIAESLALVCLAGLSGLLAMTVVGIFRPIMIERYFIPVVPPILLIFAFLPKPTARLAIVALCFVSLNSVSALHSYMLGKASFGFELPARFLSGARRVTWYAEFSVTKVLDPPGSRAILADGFARAGRMIEPRYSSNLTEGDAFIFFYRTRARLSSVVPRRPWRCRDLRYRDGGTLLCERPKLSP